ncbi:hypothetical protein C4J85_0530 [Pseudomonas sp. R4-34-07]|uniref:dermonecrotic toxin domain-containing protein n=1 Tax=Pseudomonas sp. R4-34-07 TaxID=658642 RepID=UPI000F561BA4|nr:DUF6543 domain-containing protein [Pseudomonas sp. R4-34-07]AZF51043.1 hypothetical protein C4J85_0530 [Pseudomonas sp. R4-34-07]
MSSPLPQSPHKAFIKSNLPAWLTQAPASQLADFRRDLISSNQARHDLKALMDELQNPEEFARPLLRQTLRTEFFGLQDDENAILSREWKNHHLLGLIRTHARTTRQTLLEAALQNFEATEAETGGMETGSAIYNPGPTGEVLSIIAATRFASVCRNLDIGSQYLAHIDNVLEPAPNSGTSRTAAEVMQLLSSQEQLAFGVALHIAYLQNAFTTWQFLQLRSLQTTGNNIDIRCSLLTLQDVVLPNVMVIQASAIGLPMVLYTPQDPSAAFRLHPTWEDLYHGLAERLEQPQYLAFFTRLVPLQHQDSLLHLAPRPSLNARPSLESTLSLTPVRMHVFQDMATQRIIQIRNDARILAVPTADVDLVSRQKRLQGYLELGKSLLFFAASFIPIVGEVLLAVSALQLLNTVYDGFAAWSRGDSEEALNDFLDAVDDVAMAVATAGVIKTAGFGVKLLKVHVANKGLRLWNPDLPPYRHPKMLPDGLVADKQGLYKHAQRYYLKLDDQVHAVQRAPDSQQWQLSHPTDPDAYAPPVRGNSVGGWRVEHETPADWDDLKLIQRLGPDGATIKQPAVEPILLLGGMDSAGLRELHQDMLRPPPLLRDTIKHFNLDQEIADFNLDRAEGTKVTPQSPFIQFHLVCALPEWPATRRLKIVDERQQILISHGNGANAIEVSASRFRKGELLHALEEQMPRAEFNQLLPALYIDYFTPVENLASRLQESVPAQRQRLFSLLDSHGEEPVSQVEQDLRPTMPELSKRHLEEMETTLSPQERQRLHQEKKLPSTQEWEATQYRDVARSARIHEGIFLDSMSSNESVPLVLHTLEQLPGWPGARRIEVYENDNSGPLLGHIGSEQDSVRHILIRQGEQYAVQDAEATELHAPSTLFSALEHTLTEAERSALLRESNAGALKQAIHQHSLAMIAKPPLPPLARLAPTAPVQALGIALDPLFATQTAPAGLTLRADGIHQSAPLPNGGYHYYVLEGGNYFQVKAEGQKWRLIDARSPFRAYRPYLRAKTAGGWDIDPSSQGLMGGMQAAVSPSGEPTELSDEFESAHSSSEYDSAEEGTVNSLYTPTEMEAMRSTRSYQHSQNYRRIYDRANNGRYPLRDLTGRPLRIRSIQIRSKSLTSDQTFSKELILPFLQWEGYERVARLYEDKLEVTPFTAAHQKCVQEAVMIGEQTVISRKPLIKGEALGVYGGELVPYYVAAYRQDPYLIDVKPFEPIPAAPQPVILSGDNVLSRINTIFEYEANLPIRQASTGYNVEVARFNVTTQIAEQPRDNFFLSAFFASEDIPAGTELRWNYQYNEPTVRALFGALPQANA